MKTHLVVADAVAGKPDPVDGVLALLDVLLGRTALIVEGQGDAVSALLASSGHEDRCKLAFDAHLGHGHARALCAQGQ